MGCDVNQGSRISLLHSVFTLQRKITWCSGVLCTAVATRNTRGDFLHQIQFYGDTRAEALKRRRRWISFVNGNKKTLDSEQVFSDLLISNSAIRSN